MMVKSEDIQFPQKSCSSVIIGYGSKQLTRMNPYELRILSVIDYRRINKRVKVRSIEMVTSSCHVVQHSGGARIIVNPGQKKLATHL